jgi:hypothetical protein
MRSSRAVTRAGRSNNPQIQAAIPTASVIGKKMLLVMAQHSMKPLADDITQC